MRTPINPSPSGTYVIPVYSIDFKTVSFRRFTLPKDKENTCSYATWYFYNILDTFSCGEEAYPIEMHLSISNAGEAINFDEHSPQTVFSKEDVDNLIAKLKANKDE